MAAKSTALTTTIATGSPYQLDKSQILRASKALVQYIRAQEKQNTENGYKRNLLAEDSESSSSSTTPIWLTLTTKKHITTTQRLKPSKITLPHPIPLSPDTSICLITADPQRAYKDLIASPSFPTPLAKLITRVIAISKLATKYSQYEAQRQLRATHDIFLADDRILPRLSKILGKSFYKSTTKRPIPISMQPAAPRVDGKRIARTKNPAANEKPVIEAAKLAAEIEKTLKMTLVTLAPSTNTSVRVGSMGLSAEQIAENVDAVATQLIEKFVPQKWRSVRAIHIKGPETAALPVWLAEEMWVSAEDVKGDQILALPDVDEQEEETAVKAIMPGKSVEANVGKKRKRPATDGGQEEEWKRARDEKRKEKSSETLDADIAARKEKLRAMKAKAEKTVVDEV